MNAPRHPHLRLGQDSVGRSTIVLEMPNGDAKQIGVALAMSQDRSGRSLDIDMMLTIPFIRSNGEILSNVRITMADEMTVELNKAREDGAKAERARLAQKIAEALR